MNSSDVHKFVDEQCKTPTGIWAACLIMVGHLESLGEHDRLKGIGEAAMSAQHRILMAILDSPTQRDIAKAEAAHDAEKEGDV